MVIESTCGDRAHSPVDPETELIAPLARALTRGGVVIVPTFAIGRAQLLLHLIGRLKAKRAIPDVRVYLNSPMAEDATPLSRDYPDEHRLSAAELAAMTGVAHFVSSVEESKALNRRSGPMIIVAGVAWRRVGAWCITWGCRPTSPSVRARWPLRPARSPTLVGTLGRER